ncbi:phage holin family protein [Ornithinibacillus scapharcae]|uniref:phage holin family protein n=1 Tax=Ornithinibacillus scapharcae TaxID=1147159 RepID=UPI000225B122|nr:phage holin family protein [Ornithinibacillus scapharcae]
MFTRWILSLILNAIALWVVAQIFESFHIGGFGTAILAAFILSLLNVIVKPILIVLTLPLTVLTLGLFLFVINAITLMITQAVIGETFIIDGFGTALIAAIVLSILNILLTKFVKDPLTS